MPSAKDQPLLTRIAELAGADVAAAVQREFGGFVKYIPAGQMAQYNAALVDALMAESRRANGKQLASRGATEDLLALTPEWRSVTPEQTIQFRGQTHPVGGECLPGQRVLVVAVPAEPHTSAAPPSPGAAQPGSAASACPHCNPSAAGHAGRTPPHSDSERPLPSVLAHGSGLWTDETYQLLALMNKMQAIVLNRLIADEAHANDLFGGAL